MPGALFATGDGFLFVMPVATIATGFVGACKLWTALVRPESSREWWPRFRGPKCLRPVLACLGHGSRLVTAGAGRVLGLILKTSGRLALGALRKRFTR